MQTTGMQGSNTGANTAGVADLAERTSGKLSQLSDTAQQTMERVTQAASQAASRLTARGEELLHSQAAENARTYMREHPLATIGIAVAVGVVLARLLSRR